LNKRQEKGGGFTASGFRRGDNVIARERNRDYFLLNWGWNLEADSLYSPKKLGGKLKLSEYFRYLVVLEEARSSLHPSSRQGDLL
jgi:hypothetical protein